MILFKNQELAEFSADLRARDEKISMLENVWFRSRENISEQVRRSPIQILAFMNIRFDYLFLSG